MYYTTLLVRGANAGARKKKETDWERKKQQCARECACVFPNVFVCVLVKFKISEKTLMPVIAINIHQPLLIFYILGVAFLNAATTRRQRGKTKSTHQICFTHNNNINDMECVYILLRSKVKEREKKLLIKCDGQNQRVHINSTMDITPKSYLNWLFDGYE